MVERCWLSESCMRNVQNRLDQEPRIRAQKHASQTLLRCTWNQEVMQKKKIITHEIKKHKEKEAETKE